MDGHKQALDIADAKIAKTDHTMWFKRTGWTEHLAGTNITHLSNAIRIPDRYEIVLQRAAELVDILIERAVGGLSSLDQETRRWLRSAKPSAPDVRPLARLQKPESQARYAGYMRRCVCYCLRVCKSDELLGAAGDGGGSSSDIESEVTDDSGDETDDSSSTKATTTRDILYDARKLFPWQDGLKACLEKLWNVIEWRVGDEFSWRVIWGYSRNWSFNVSVETPLKAHCCIFWPFLESMARRGDYARRTTFLTCWLVWCTVCECSARKSCCRQRRESNKAMKMTKYSERSETSILQMAHTAS